jgi:hypothetical protein
MLGGDFTTLAPNGRPPVTRNYVARLNHDGTVDPTFQSHRRIARSKPLRFNPTARSFSAATSALSRLMAEPRSIVPMWRGLMGTAPSDTTFDSHPNGPVHAVGVQADGAIVIGGEFSGFFTNGAPVITRNRIARLNADGSLDPNFNPNANSTVDAIVVQPDGRTIIGGRFTTLTPLDPARGHATTSRGLT